LKPYTPFEILCEVAGCIAVLSFWWWCETTFPRPEREPQVMPFQVQEPEQ
jgi:hypothetical protein